MMVGKGEEQMAMHGIIENEPPKPPNSYDHFPDVVPTPPQGIPTPPQGIPIPPPEPKEGEDDGA